MDIVIIKIAKISKISRNHSFKKKYYNKYTKISKFSGCVFTLLACFETDVTYFNIKNNLYKR